MQSITVSDLIKASPQTIFDIATDVMAYPARLVHINDVTMVTNGEMGVGTRWRETRTILGRIETVEMQVAEYIPYTRLVVTCHLPTVHYQTAYEFREHALGVRADVTFTATPVTSFAKILSLLTGWFSAIQMRNSLQQDLAAMKKAAEAATVAVVE
jgi:Polyketide cyclase / dehydrase and lipid transport